LFPLATPSLSQILSPLRSSFCEITRVFHPFGRFPVFFTRRLRQKRFIKKRRLVTQRTCILTDALAASTNDLSMCSNSRTRGRCCRACFQC
jgi:hypothetical protein